MPTVQFGLDRLLADTTLRRPLAGKRVALLAHPAAIVAALEALLGPDLAMRSSDAPDADFPRLTAARDVAASQCGLLTGSHAVWRLVVASTGESVVGAGQ